MVSAGKNTINDSQHVEARLADAQAAVQDIKGDYASSVARFVELTGHEPGRLNNARVPDQYLPKSLQAALEQGRKRNRSLGIANATVEVAKADLATTDTPFYPSLNIEANAGRNFDVAGETGHQTTMTALLVARYNLFNGFQNIERTREYIDRVTTAKHRREAEIRRVEREIRTAWEEMRTAQQQSLALQQAVVNKGELLKSNLGQFDSGTTSFPEILNSAHESFLAQGSKITADASYDIASLKLLTSMGKLVELYTGIKCNPQKKAAPAA
ncbi:MAG: TolC family protein [Janthinobacterium lividum]